MQAALDDGLDVVLARPFNHTGPRQEPVFAVPSFARQVARIEAGLEPPVIRVGNLDSRRDLTDVRDVATAYVRIVAAGRPGRPYNVCSGRAWRIGDLLEELIHLARVPITVEVDPGRLRPNDVPVLQGSATRIRTELGWKPEITIEQTILDTLDYWRDETAAGR
jgi:GDP-4-dehydro-6-deoxy-D-mannose reductase